MTNQWIRNKKKGEKKSQERCHLLWIDPSVFPFLYKSWNWNLYSLSHDSFNLSNEFLSCVWTKNNRMWHHFIIYILCYKLKLPHLVWPFFLFFVTSFFYFRMDSTRPPLFFLLCSRLQKKRIEWFQLGKSNHSKCVTRMTRLYLTLCWTLFQKRWKQNRMKWHYLVWHWRMISIKKKV